MAKFHTNGVVESDNVDEMQVINEVCGEWLSTARPENGRNKKNLQSLAYFLHSFTFIFQSSVVELVEAIANKSAIAKLTGVDRNLGKRN